MAELEATGRDRTMSAASTLNNWALIHYDTDPVKAEPLSRRAVELHRAVEGQAGATPSALLNYAAVLAQLDRYDEAELIYRETIRTAHARAEHRTELSAMVEVANVDTARGDTARAAAELTEAERTFLKTPLFIPARQAGVAYARGLIALAHGDAAGARAFFIASLAKFATLALKANANVIAFLGLARAEQALGHLAEAEAAARQGLALAESFVGKGTQTHLIGRSLLQLGEIELARGDREAARATLSGPPTSCRRLSAPPTPTPARRAASPIRF